MKTYDRICSICNKDFVTKYVRQHICCFTCHQEKVRQAARGRKRHIRYGICIKDKPCIVCGFSDTVDVHHEGKDLYILCPNHYALITRGIKTIKQLLS